MLDILPLLQVPVDVLDGDGRVVDEDADGERQAAQRHDVERLGQDAESAAISAPMHRRAGSRPR